MSEHTLKIEDGVISFVYSDELVDLTKQGETTITRASHVEPHPSQPGWIADMRPSGGPILGRYGHWDPQGMATLLGGFAPFETRQEALDAERDWLRKEKGL